MDQTEKATAVAVVAPAIIALIHSFELPNEEARRAQAEDRSVSSIVRAALKAYLEGAARPADLEGQGVGGGPVPRIRS